MRGRTIFLAERSIYLPRMLVGVWNLKSVPNDKEAFGARGWR
jgi:hypothetical protein